MKINSRNKGQRGEREICGILQDISDRVCFEKKIPAPEVVRNLVQSRNGGEDIVGLPGLAVEVKRQENLQLASWWKQTLEQAQRARAIPVLVYKRNYQPWKVVMLASLHYGSNEVQYQMELSMDDFRDWLYLYLQDHYSKEL